MNRKERRALGKPRGGDIQIGARYTGSWYGATQHFIFRAASGTLDAIEREWLNYIALCRAHYPEEEYTDDDADNARQFVFSFLLTPEYHGDEKATYLAAGALIFLARAKNYDGTHISFILSDNVETPGGIDVALCGISEPEVEDALRKLKRKGKVTSFVDENGVQRWRLAEPRGRLH